MEVFVVFTVAARASLKCQLTANDAGGINWSVTAGAGGVVANGSFVAVHVGGAWHASGGALLAPQQASKPLELLSVNTASGEDGVLGRYHDSTAVWSASGTAFSTGCRTYATPGGLPGELVAFTSRFPAGASGTRTPAGAASVLQNWPAADFIAYPYAQSWQGEFVSPYPGRTYGPAGGPIAFFSDPRRADAPAEHEPGVVVASPLDHFKVSATSARRWDGADATKGWIAGTLGSVTSLPRDFSHSFGLFTLSGAGLTSTVEAWGRLIQAMNPPSKTRNLINDTTLTRLEYQTDNGAQYCFCKENCSAQLLDVKAGLAAADVEIGVLSFQGGWWKNRELHTAACAPWYAPYFCMDTPYARKFAMLTSNTSLPGCKSYNFKTPSSAESARFYEWFMGYGIDHYGMTSFEVDFLHQNFICVDEFLSVVDAAKGWLEGMDRAAIKKSLDMQWCMATPSDALTAVGLGSVTNFRTSTDFYYGSSWDIGISSLLIWSLGFAPSKDTFWTTDQRDVAIALGGCPGNGCPADHTAAGAELHTMLAVMSTGPVGFSDAAGRTDAALLRRGSVGHGVVVKPSRPLTSVDSTFLPNIAPAGHVLATRTVWARYRGWFFVYHQLTEPYTVSAADFDRASDVWLSGGVVWREFHAGGCSNGTAGSSCVSLIPAGDSVKITLQPRSETSHDGTGSGGFEPGLVVVAPVCSNGWAVLGDLGKFASLSPTLFRSVVCSPFGVTVDVIHTSTVTFIRPPATEAAESTVLVLRLEPGSHSVGE